jgi:metal-responsive CopG/Arc/MetJ family transcriptional regulator
MSSETNSSRQPSQPKQQFNVYLPPNLIKELKHHCIERGGSLSNLVEQIFRDFLKRQKEKNP